MCSTHENLVLYGVYFFSFFVCICFYKSSKDQQELPDFAFIEQWMKILVAWIGLKCFQFMSTLFSLKSTQNTLGREYFRIGFEDVFKDSVTYFPFKRTHLNWNWDVRYKIFIWRISIEEIDRLCLNFPAWYRLNFFSLALDLLFLSSHRYDLEKMGTFKYFKLHGVTYNILNAVKMICA